MELVNNILKPKEKEEILNSLKDKSLQELVSIGKKMHIIEPIIIAIKRGALRTQLSVPILDVVLYLGKKEILDKIMWKFSKDVLETKMKDVDDILIADVFLKNGIVPTIDTMCELLRKNNVGLFEYYIKRGIDPSRDNNALLSCALHVKNKEIVTILLNNDKVSSKLTNEQIRKYMSQNIVKESLA